MREGGSEMDEQVGRYVDFVYAAVVRQMGANGAEDVTQAVFLVMARKKRGGWLPEEKFMMGWLLQVTRYAVKESRRAAMRRGYHEKQAGVAPERVASSKKQVE